MLYNRLGIIENMALLTRSHVFGRVRGNFTQLESLREFDNALERYLDHIVISRE